MFDNQMKWAGWFLAWSLAGAAQAQTVPTDAAPVRPVINLGMSQATVAPTSAHPDGVPGVAGVVRTALDSDFGSRGGVTGSVGYLCGLQPGPYMSSSPASSADAEGTFLGAKLSLAFK